MHQRRHRRTILGVLFAALLYTALVPAGFMPAGDGSFSLQVCHSGLPDSEAAAHHSHGHSHAELCPFGALPGAGPATQLAAWRPIWSVAPQLERDHTTSRPSFPHASAHRPRGPPSLA